MSRLPRVVEVLRCRVPQPEAPYRNGGVGTRLLQHALNEGSSDEFIQDAYLHVQTNNDDAIAFYKRHGFVADVVVPNYYKRLDPPDAVILKLDLKQWKVRPHSRAQIQYRPVTLAPCEVCNAAHLIGFALFIASRLYIEIRADCASYNVM